MADDLNPFEEPVAWGVEFGRFTARPGQTVVPCGPWRPTNWPAILLPEHWVSGIQEGNILRQPHVILAKGPGFRGGQS